MAAALNDCCRSIPTRLEAHSRCRGPLGGVVTTRYTPAMQHHVRVAALALVFGWTATAEASVFAWHEGTTLHLSNDPATPPAHTAVRRFDARARPPASATRTEADTTAPESLSVSRTNDPRSATPPLAGWEPWRVQGAIVIAPTIVVRQRGPAVTIIDDVSSRYRYPFLPSGFIGHEHPQIPFLRGRRLVPHSHFFPRGRAGLYTPYGHFSSEGLVVPSVPIY